MGLKKVTELFDRCESLEDFKEKHLYELRKETRLSNDERMRQALYRCEVTLENYWYRVYRLQDEDLD